MSCKREIYDHSLTDLLPFKSLFKMGKSSEKRYIEVYQGYLAPRGVIQCETQAQVFTLKGGGGEICSEIKFE